MIMLCTHAGPLLFLFFFPGVLRRAMRHNVRRDRARTHASHCIARGCSISNDLKPHLTQIMHEQNNPSADTYVAGRRCSASTHQSSKWLTTCQYFRPGLASTSRLNLRPLKSLNRETVFFSKYTTRLWTTDSSKVPEPSSPALR